MSYLTACEIKAKPTSKAIDKMSIGYRNLTISHNKKSWGQWVVNDEPFVISSRHFNNPTKVFLKRTELELETSEGTFVLDDRLENIYNVIKESVNLLNLKDDWDQDGAVGCNPKVYDRAINLLVKYSQNVLKYYAEVLEAPEINLAKDGSIDLEWRHKTGILLINILNIETFEAHFYGENIKTETSIKGFLKSYVINRNLSYWMQSLV